MAIAPRAVPLLDFWLATHRAPTSTPSARYICAHGVLSGEIPADGWEAYGIHPDGWLPVGQDRPRKIDWFQPHVTGLPTERRWPILLAGYAACVYNCRHLACPKNRSLHSILYAALWRGRDDLRETDPAGESADKPAPHLAGAREFFDEALRAARRFAQSVESLVRLGAGREPRVCPGAGAARPGVAGLRARHPSRPPHHRVRPANGRGVRLLVSAGAAAAAAGGGRPAQPAANPQHLHPPAGDAAGQAYRQVDGIYLRDPQCLLFKEWARSDTEHSTLGQGFLFTAIAYSGERDSPQNHSNYFFSLDPEVAQAQGLHLYNVWAQLQTNEAAAWERKSSPLEPSEKAKCREGYEARAGCQPDKDCTAGAFSDPWFDGANYGATIVATPNAGSLLPEGTAADLSNDPVAAIVQCELEHSIFEPVVHIEELSYKRAQRDPPAVQHPLFDAEPLPLRENFWRFGHVRLRRDVELTAGPMAEQIGRVLWRQLEPQSDQVLPRDFHERHLLRGSDWVGVWSRRGIMMAWLPAAPQRVTQFLQPLRTLAQLAGEIEEYCGPLNVENGRGLSPFVQSAEQKGTVPLSAGTANQSPGRNRAAARDRARNCRAAWPTIAANFRSWTTGCSIGSSTP